MPSTVVALNHDECVRRLSITPVGRVGVTSKALPVIVPVNYVLSRNSIVFRTESGGMLAQACDGTVVAFEIDDLADDGSAGWSVLVVGVAELLDGSAALRAMETGLVSAAGSGRDQFVAIRIGTVTGRSVPVPTTEALSP